MKCRVLYNVDYSHVLHAPCMIDSDGSQYQVLWFVDEETGECNLVRPGTFNITEFNAQSGANFQPSTWGNPPEACFKYEIPMSLELSKIQTATAIQQQNEHLVEKAKAGVTPAIAEVKTLHANLATADAITLENADQKLNELQVKLKDSYELIEQRRKPITQELDAIKSKLIEPGKAVLVLGTEVKSLRDAWAAEKVRRDREAEKKKQDDINKANDLIRVKQEWTNGWNTVFLNKLASAKKGLSDKFYSLKTEAEFEDWKCKLKAWNTEKVALDNPVSPRSQYMNAEDIQRAGNKISGELQPRFNAEFHAAMTEEIADIIEKIPGRLAELKAGAEALAAAEARRKKEDEERAAEAARLEKERKQAAESEAAADQLNATMEIAQAAVPTVEKTKGTVVKQKYVPTSHKAWAALLQSWVANDMALMTLEDLAKKLSFVKTAAEKRLNDKKEPVEIKAEGLEVEEDYSTRGSRIKAA